MSGSLRMPTIDVQHTITTPPADELRGVLNSRAADWTAQASRLRQQSDKLTRIRTVDFWIGLAALLLVWFGVLPGWLGYSIAAAAVVAWIVLVSRHNRLDVALARAEEQTQVNRGGLARLDRNWEALPAPSYHVPAELQTTCDDLNLFGRRSLFQLLCHAATPDGVHQLGDWLLRGGTRDEVRQREEAAAELTDQLDLRQELEIRARLLHAADSGPREFCEWAASPQLPIGGRWVWIARLLAAATVAMLVVASTNLFPADLGWAIVSLLVVVNIVLTGLFAPRIHEVYRTISSRHDEVGQYRELFDTMRRMPTASAQLARLHAAVTDEAADASARLEELSDVMNLADIRKVIVLYVPLQLLALWDLHIAGKLARWQQAHGRHAPRWFAALGEFEALCSLASLAYLHPDWTFAEVDETSDGEVVFSADQLGHPLIAPTHCVRNDVAVGPPGRLLLVTGSNMSGKSTLLRAIGANVFLAQAGAPVCAARLHMPRLRVVTSMRIQDSLADGVSFFLAELQRLKSIVDLAADIQPGEPALLYLLDEILQGTNSAERFVAVQTVIARLLEAGAIGAVSTHDLKLATVEPVRSAAEIVHFREQMHAAGEGPRMSFDYRLRDGVATSTNALALLEMIGLGKPLDAFDDSPPH